MTIEPREEASGAPNSTAALAGCDPSYPVLNLLSNNISAGILDTAVEDFENAKRRFNGFLDATGDKEMSIHIPRKEK